MSAVVVGMVKVMRVLSVVNPIVLAILVGLWGRAAMMEGRAVGGAEGVVFAIVLASGVSAAMWMGKNVPMMVRIVRHEGGSVPRVSWRKELSEARGDLVKPVIYLAACALLAVALATVPGGGMSRAWGAGALVWMGADRLLCEALCVVMRARLFASLAQRHADRGGAS